MSTTACWGAPRDLERAVAAVRAAALAVARLGDPTSFAAMAALGVSAQ